MIRMTLTALAPALALGLAAPAMAQTATIEVHDLDLSTDAGQARLKTRISAAARSVCRDAGLTGTRVRDWTKRGACMASVARQAAEQVAAREAAGAAGG